MAFLLLDGKNLSALCEGNYRKHLPRTANGKLFCFEILSCVSLSKMTEDLWTFAVMGVDPGTEGAVSVLTDQGEPALVEPLHAGMTTKKVVDIVEEASRILHGLGSNLAFLEKVGYIGRRQDGRKDGGKGAFTFGRVAGMLEGTLHAFKNEVHLVFPMIWQSKLNCLSGGNKNVTKRKAQELFPQLGNRITHNTADSLLIAEFGRKQSAL